MGGTPAKTEIIQPPMAPAPSAGESSADLYKSRLEYDPQVAALEMGIQQQYAPEQAALQTAIQQQQAPALAQLYTDVQSQQMPQLQALQQQLFPGQSQVVEASAEQALQRLQDPNYMTAGERTAQRGSREEAVGGLQEAMRTRANLGGGLFGGRAAGSEQQGVSDLMSSFEEQDYNRRLQGASLAQQAATPLMQILYPQVSMPQAQGGQFGYTSATPSADALYGALAQQSRGWEPTVQHTAAQQSPMWGLAGSALGAAGMAASSKRYKKNIKLWAKP